MKTRTDTITNGCHNKSKNKWKGKELKTALTITQVEYA